MPPVSKNKCVLWRILSGNVLYRRNENGIRVIQARMPYPQINSKPNYNKQFYASCRICGKYTYFLRL